MVITIQGTEEEIIAFGKLLENGKKVDHDSTLLILIKQDRYVDAIRLCRDIHNIPLHKAKEHVDSLREKVSV